MCRAIYNFYRRKEKEMKLPKEMKLTKHAQQRLAERKDEYMKYNTRNLMRSSVKWYGKDDLIHDCALYRHCCYTTRKSNQIGYITDGNIEVIYNKGTKTAITILEVKDKFKPITQFIKPEILNQIERKREIIKMKKDQIKDQVESSVCLDCGKEAELNEQGICVRCVRRKVNMKSRGREYVRYLDLSKIEQKKLDRRIEGQVRGAEKRRKEKEESSKKEESVELKVPDNENYYASKANQTEIATHPMMAPINTKNTVSPLSDQFSFIKILKGYGCEIPEQNLEEILDTLLMTDNLRKLFMTMIQNNNQKTISDLNNSLETTEKKLRYEWEYNGFQEADDIKFKGFLTWRRVLKEAITFWENLFQTGAITELQKLWNTEDNKISTNEEENDTTIKRFQITTESISTIFNTKRPFTRVFYAISKDEAYTQFVKWMADRNLHENKSKTTIVELGNNNSESIRKDA